MLDLIKACETESELEFLEQCFVLTDFLDERDGYFCPHTKFAYFRYKFHVESCFIS